MKTCASCGVILTHLTDAEAAFVHHHACVNHPQQRWNRTALLAQMAATMDTAIGIELDADYLAHRAETLLAAIEKRACVDIPELRNVVQIISGNLELMEPSPYRNVALKAVYERLVPLLEPKKEMEKVS